MSNNCDFQSGRCAFCGESLRNTPTPIPVAYGAPSDEGRGTFTKLKPLRWRFLTNKAPREKFMCTTCAEKRQRPQRVDQQNVSLDSSWDGVHKPYQQNETNSKQKSSDHDRVRQQRKSQKLHEKREKLPERYRENRASTREPVSSNGRRSNTREPLSSNGRRLSAREPLSSNGRRLSTREPVSSNGRRRRATQTSDLQDPTQRSSVLQPFANHRVSRESMRRNRPASTPEIRARTSVPKQRASVDTPTRPRKTSGQSEPRGSEKKDQRLSSTADILGMSRSLELPPNYFDMSSVSPQFTTNASEKDRLNLTQLEMQLPQVEPRKQNETDEERLRRRSVSYAHMLIRMRRHYGAVQVDGTNSHPTTAPPRRIRAERRAKSVAVHDAAEDDPIKMDDLANFTLDLDYLREFKDAR